MLIKGAIFDFDGTLFDSMWVWKNVDLEFLSKYNKVPSSEIRQRVKSMSVWDSAKLYNEQYNLNIPIENLVNDFSNIIYEKYKYQIQPKNYVVEYLEQLKSENIKLCIATTSLKKSVLSALERINMTKYFDFIISADDVKTSKESPEMFMLCAKKFNLQPKEILVFEDSLVAIKTAKKQGFNVVGIYDASNSHLTDEIKKHADYYIFDYIEAEKIVKLNS